MEMSIQMSVNSFPKCWVETYSSSVYRVMFQCKAMFCLVDFRLHGQYTYNGGSYHWLLIQIQGLYVQSNF